MKRISLALAASMGLAIFPLNAQESAKEPERLIWKTNLSIGKPGDRAFGFGPKCVIMEENGKLFVRKSSGELLNSGLSYLGSWAWGDCELRFSFRFPEKVDDIVVTIKNGGFREQVKYQSYMVKISARTIILGGTRDLDKEIQDKPGTTAKIDELLPNKWYRCVVRSEKDIVKVFMEKDGKMIEMASSEAFPGGGGVQLDSKSILDLADIEIIEINPVPRVYGEVDKNGRLLGTPPEKAPAPKEKDPILDEK